jgi:alpha-L-fucosidase
MIRKNTFFVLLALPLLFRCGPRSTDTLQDSGLPAKLPDSVRVANILDLKWGMFLHWSLGTFSGEEWTKGISDPAFFAAPAADTDQWCRVARDAGMGYILFVAKHHDGFCLWDTQTTEFNVTNSRLERDVLADLRKSCDKYGIALCLYFSEADWTWPGMENAEMKAAQLTELFTGYGEIPLVWMDVAQWDGGLDHRATEALIRKYQPNTFIGFNHGMPAGDLQSREVGTFEVLKPSGQEPLPAPVFDSLLAVNKQLVLDLNWQGAAEIERILMNQYPGYRVAECAIPINQLDGRWYWFYNEATEANAIPAAEIHRMYADAIRSKVLFSLALGPDRSGSLRAVDVQRLKEVGEMIREDRSTR